MNDVCPKETEFFQRNHRSHSLNFISRILNKFAIRESAYLKQLGIYAQIVDPNHEILEGTGFSIFRSTSQKLKSLNPDQSKLEKIYDAVESGYVEGTLPNTVPANFIDRFRRVIGLEYLSKQNKYLHR